MRLPHILLLFLLASALPVPAEDAPPSDPMRWKWFEFRTPHFNITTCASFADVRNFAQRLEQFHDAYGQLAGRQAVASPPITVMAFPSDATLEPFLPLYDGKPANLSGFFQRANDENLIVVSFLSDNPAAMDVIFHEYAHLLFRRNENIWPLWLQEGMAEIYSTFEGYQRAVRIGSPIPRHVRTVAEGALIPIQTLMHVGHDSPMYNERDQQGMFYAESWLLTHYLMNGDSPALKSRFGRFTALLREGQPMDDAFTNALGVSFANLDRLLKNYARRGVFQPVNGILATSLDASRVSAARSLTPVETAFRLGKELMRVRRTNDAEGYFRRALQMAPASPLPYEGLGLLAAECDRHAEAVDWLRKSFDHDSSSFLAHAVYAHQKMILAEDSKGNLSSLTPETATEVRDQLQASIQLMPDFATAHQLLGLLYLVTGRDYNEARKRFEIVAELQPENQTCQLYLAQANFRLGNRDDAMTTLRFLSQHARDPQIKDDADELIKQFETPSR